MKKSIKLIKSAKSAGSVKSVYKLAILVSMLLIGIFSCDFLENKTIHVPKGVIQGKVDKKFPITKNVLISKITLKNPKVDFKGERMYVESDYDASLLNESSRGKMYLSTNIKYDEKNEDVYLVDLSIDKIIDENGKEVTNSSTEKKVKALIINYIEMSPVYKYGEEYEEKNKDREKKQIKIKNMYIKNGKFYVQT